MVRIRKHTHAFSFLLGHLSVFIDFNSRDFSFSDPYTMSGFFYTWRAASTGKDPISGPADLKMIHSGKVLEDSKTFEGEPLKRPHTKMPFSHNHHLARISMGQVSDGLAAAHQRITLASGFFRLQGTYATKSHHAFAAQASIS
jgi:hypothetical protein